MTNDPTATSPPPGQDNVHPLGSPVPPADDNVHPLGSPVPPADDNVHPLGTPAEAAPPAQSTEEIARLIAAKHAELSAKGYSEGVVTAALTRSMAIAMNTGGELRPEIREPGTLDLLRADLEHTEAWCESYQASMSE